MSVQAPSAVIVIRPHHFTPNPVTAADNSFQSTRDSTAEVTAQPASAEVTTAAETLRAFGIAVHVFDDVSRDSPDSVFPNNWISTHAGGHVALYPMFAPNRRTERRADIVEFLKHDYRVQDIIDYSGLEQDSVFLEGTGAMVLDHDSRIAYTCRSNRADPVLLERFCTNFGFEPMVFSAQDDLGRAIYHTNVMMCIATEFALVAADLIGDQARRAEIVERLSARGRREVLSLTLEQVRDFAGNAIELQGTQGRILAISRRGLAALTAEQLAVIERSCVVVPLDVPTIELAGGSVRCMLAGVHLDERPKAAAA